MSAVTTTKKKSFTTFQMAHIAVMAAITCILGPLSIPIPISPVPISLTNLAIYLTVCLLGWKFGTISYLIYLLIGIAGLPVFSGFSSGFAKLFKRKSTDDCHWNKSDQVLQDSLFSPVLVLVLQSF